MISYVRPCVENSRLEASAQYTLQQAPPALDQAQGNLQPRPASAVNWWVCAGWPVTPALLFTDGSASRSLSSCAALGCPLCPALLSLSSSSEHIFRDVISSTEASLCVIITDAGTSSSSTFEGLLDRVLNRAALASLYLVFTPESSRNMLQPAIPQHEWLHYVSWDRGVGNATNARRCTARVSLANHTRRVETTLVAGVKAT